MHYIYEMKFGTYQKVKDLKAGMKNYDQKKYRNNHDIQLRIKF